MSTLIKIGFLLRIAQPATLGIHTFYLFIFVYRYWWLSAHHINDLLEREPECEVDGVRVVVNRALQVLVILQQVV